MNKKILVPDEYIIDFSLTKEEREKKEKNMKLPVIKLLRNQVYQKIKK